MSQSYCIVEQRNLIFFSDYLQPYLKAEFITLPSPTCEKVPKKKGLKNENVCIRFLFAKMIVVGTVGFLRTNQLFLLA